MNTLWLMESSSSRLAQLRQEAKNESLVRQARCRVPWNLRALLRLPTLAPSSAPCPTC